jgi:hypothetical protein
MQPLDGQGLRRARALDLAGEHHLEHPRGRDGDADIREPQDRPGPLTDPSVGLQECQAAHGNGADRGNVDDPLGIDDDLLPGNVQAARDLHLEDVPVAQAVVWTRDASCRNGDDAGDVGSRTGGGRSGSRRERRRCCGVDGSGSWLRNRCVRREEAHDEHEA